jgi:hypothetical protein
VTISGRRKLSDEPLTPQEFERLCVELADLDRKTAHSNLRRRQIEEELRRTISNYREDTAFAYAYNAKQRVRRVNGRARNNARRC